MAGSTKTSQAAGGLGVGWQVRAVVVLLAGLAAIYVVACTVYNMPDSPVKVRIVGAARTVIHPWFDQDWQLFAPTPSTSNSRVWVTAQVRSITGAVRTTTAFDVEYPIEDELTTNHVLPTKAPGITLAMNETWSNYRGQLQAVDQLPTSVRSIAHQQLDARFATDFDSLDRFLSFEAQRHFPGEQVIRIRAKFVNYPMTPFSQREMVHPFAQKPHEQLQTDWMPYAAGVAAS